MASAIAVPELYLDAEVSELQRAMIRYGEVTGKRFGAVVKQNTRLIAWNLAHNSQPYGLTLAEKKQGEAAVMRDVGKVFASASQIFEQLKAEDEKLARAFYKLIQGGGYGQAEKLLRQHSNIRDRNAAVFAPLDPDLHQQARRRNGRVYRQRAAQIVPDAKSIAKYAKERAAFVGFGKAGFITAGSSLGSITRVPAWVKRHQGKAPGRAHDESARKDDPFITLTNEVRYASAILPDHAIAAALKLQREKMLAHMEHVLVHTAREAGFEAHATAPSTALPAAA